MAEELKTATEELEEPVHTFEDFIAELNKLWDMPAENFYESGGTIYMNVGGDDEKYKKMQELCNLAECLCDDFLIEKGQPNWTNIKALQGYGYRVRCTEKDSFGWLGAAVEKGGRSLFFG